MRFPRLHGWFRRLSLGLAAIAVLATLALLVYQIVVRQRWKRFERELAESRAALPYVAPGRVPLLEPRVPGNAWDGYFAVLGQMPPSDSQECIAVNRVLYKKAKPEEEEIARSCVERLRPALDTLLAAARCERADARGFVLPGEGFARFRPAGALGVIARLDASLRRDAGDEAGADLKLAALAQFGLDVCRFGDGLGCLAGVGQLEGVLQEYVELIAAPGMGADQLETVAQLCEAIESNLPTSLQIRDFLHVGESLVLVEIPDDPHPWYRAHRFLHAREAYEPFKARFIFAPRAFSIREAIVEFWDAWRRTRSIFEGAESRRYSDIRADLDRDNQLRGDTWNPLVQADAWMFGIESSALRLRAHCRLLRAAIQLRQGLSPADPRWPVDPYSLKAIGYRTEGDRAVLWSEGEDGDQGGLGIWAAYGHGNDIVLVLRSP